LSAGFWNVNGWNCDRNNYLFRENVVRALELDILGISESHLKHQDTLVLEGYTLFGYKRGYLHKNARNGSGVYIFSLK
jgi:exonuclease III